MFMNIMRVTTISGLLLVILLAIQGYTESTNLFTDSRWVVDETGKRVKLTCVNWASHVDTMIAEGLNKKPVDEISNKIKTMGFNCVRFTWALYMFTNSSLSCKTARQSLRDTSIFEAEGEMEAKNPQLIDKGLVEVFKAVVDSMGNNGLMVILDNHISRPEWCCGNDDGNGFFGDRDFDPEVWIHGLSTVAEMFNGVGSVVGMSLRNELRGSRQDADDWYKYMQSGAEAVHKANPNVLVILSGLSFDTKLNFLAKRPIKVSFDRKILFEMHWYGFTDGQAWANGNPNQVCGSVRSRVINQAGYLLTPNKTYTAPLFFSEFGIDQRGTNINDNRFINCFLAFAAERDLDWAYWALQGSYYIRSGKPNLDETYGLLTGDWNNVRNSSFLARLSPLRHPIQGPGIGASIEYQMIYHPASGLCLKTKSAASTELVLGPCSETDAWDYTGEKSISVRVSELFSLCMEAIGIGKAPRLAMISCTMGKVSTKWKQVSASGLHLSAKLDDRKSTPVCLEASLPSHSPSLHSSSEMSLVTNKCKCLNRDSSCDPSSQWFAIVSSTAKLKPTLSTLPVSDM